MFNRSLARIGGLLYLAVAVGGGFSEYVRTSFSVAQHPELFRIALAADLADFVCFLGVGLLMYALLRHVNQPVAVAMLTINAVSVAIQALNMLNHAGALLAATDPRFTGGLSPAAFLELHRIGYLIAQIFFGGYLIPLGYLVYRSGLFPRALGVVLVAGAAGYVLGVVVAFASPGFTSSLATPLALVGGLGELVFLLWLLVMPTTRAAKGALRWSA